MKRIIVTGAPLGGTYVEGLERFGYEVLNGTDAIRAKLGMKIGNDSNLSEEELASALDGATIYVYGGLEPASRAALMSSRSLRMISFLGTGWDDPGCVDAPAAEELSLIVTNTPHANAMSTAEMTIALMLALEREVLPMSNAMKLGNWTPIQRRDLRGKLLGIVGMGHVGSIVAQIAAHGFGMRIAYAGPTRKEGLEKELGATHLDLAPLFAECDYVSVHSPGAETLGLVDAEVLSGVRPETMLVNTSVPEIVDGNYLIDQLEAKQIRGLAMDGMYKDPDLANRYRQLPDSCAIFTPRAAWLTQDSYDRMASMALDSIEDFVQERRSGPLRWQVQGPAT